MSVFYCWDIVNSDAEGARRVDAASASDAAVKYAEWVWEQGDHPTEIDIAVRYAGDSTELGNAEFRHVFRVEARQEWNFYASTKEDDE